MEVSRINGYDLKDKKAIRFYDDVQSMINDSLLKEGMYVKIKDVGLEYHITNIASETDYKEDLNNGLYAILINKKTVYTSEFRSKFNDDYDLLNYCLSGKFDECIINNDLTIDDVISLPSNIKIINLNTIIGDKTRIFIISNKENISISGGIFKTIDVDTTEANSYQPIVISNSENVTISNCEINTQSSDGLYIGIAYSEETFDIRTNNIKVENCKFINCARNGIVVNSGDNILINNCYFDNINTYSPGHGIDIEYEYRYTTDELYTRNLNITNCYATRCNTLVNIYPTEIMNGNCNVNIDNCVCDGVRIIIHGVSNNIQTNSLIANINNILFKNMLTDHNIRIADFRKPNYLSISNIYIDDYTGELNPNFEYGDIFIDGRTYEISNIIINNIIYLGKNTRNQTLRFKDVNKCEIKVYNSEIYNEYLSYIPFDVKFINCTGTINSSIKGNNAWFKVMKLPEYSKINLDVFSTSWLNISLTTDVDNNSITATREDNSYITKARIVEENDKKYLELFTAREYSFPFVYNLKDINNGIDKKSSSATQEMVLIETDVTLSE